MKKFIEIKEETSLPGTDFILEVGDKIIIEAEFNNQLFKYYNDIANKWGFLTVWSIYEVKDMNDKHPYSRAKVLKYDENFGKPSLTPIEGDTWLDLWFAADAVVKESGDEHHIFIEDFEDNGSYLELITGS